MNFSVFEEYCRLCLPLLQSGFPLSRAAVLISRMSTAPGDVMIFARYVVFMMQTGCTFTFASQRKFPSLSAGGWGSLFKVFELTGNIQKALELYIDQCERKRQLKQKLAGALLYPLLVTAGLVAVCVLLLLNGSLFGVENAAYLIQGALIKGGVLFLCWIALFFRWMIAVFRLDQKEQFYRIMAAGLQTGTDLVTCLRLSALSMTGLSADISRASALVQKGIPLATALRQQRVFRKDNLSLVETATDSNNLANAFNQYAQWLNSRNAARQERSLTLIEPVLLTGVGAVILVVAREAILPFLTNYGGIL